MTSWLTPVLKAAIVEQVLHCHKTCEVTEQRNAVIGTGLTVRIAQWAHGFAVRDELIKSLHAAASRCDRRAWLTVLMRTFFSTP